MSKKNAKPYSEKIHIWGRISSITAIAALMLVPIAISAHYNAWPEAGKLFNAMKVVIPVYWISGIAEVFTYAPDARRRRNISELRHRQHHEPQAALRTQRHGECRRARKLRRG